MQIKAFASIFAATALLCAAGPVAAQQVYRIVAPDGTVTFSDRAPSAGTPARTVGSAGSVATPAGSNLAGLPLEVKQAASKYPFTLYTTKDCSSCDTARSFLKTRGVPYSEKTITSNEEIKALQKLNGDGTVPFATLGGQHLKGYSENDWASYLDAAGYPAKSQLPASYQQAAAAPLIPKVLKPAAAGNASNAAPAASNPAQVEPTRVTPDNPTGIIF